MCHKEELLQDLQRLATEKDKLAANHRAELEWLAEEHRKEVAEKEE